jgi:hypothetical protein
MLDCLILGDSVAAGLALARPECVAYVADKINSQAWLSKNLEKSPYLARTVIISLGNHDRLDINSQHDIRTMRQLVKADRVFWIMPTPTFKHSAMQAVSSVAREFGDTVLTNIPKAADNIQPSPQGYKKILKETK